MRHDAEIYHLVVYDLDSVQGVLDVQSLEKQEKRIFFYFRFFLSCFSSFKFILLSSGSKFDSLSILLL